jgi:mRNA interferase RelE/StbE
VGDAQERINTVLKRLVDYYNGLDVPPPDVKILKGKYQNLLRLRVGDMRVIFKIENDEFVILVIDVVSRGDAYKK